MKVVGGPFRASLFCTWTKAIKTAPRGKRNENDLTRPSSAHLGNQLQGEEKEETERRPSQVENATPSLHVNVYILRCGSAENPDFLVDPPKHPSLCRRTLLKNSGENGANSGPLKKKAKARRSPRRSPESAVPSIESETGDRAARSCGSKPGSMAQFFLVIRERATSACAAAQGVCSKNEAESSTSDLADISVLLQCGSFGSGRNLYDNSRFLAVYRVLGTAPEGIGRGFRVNVGDDASLVWSKSSGRNRYLPVAGERIQAANLSIFLRAFRNESSPTEDKFYKRCLPSLRFASDYERDLIFRSMHSAAQLSSLGMQTPLVLPEDDSAWSACEEARSLLPKVSGRSSLIVVARRVSLDKNQPAYIAIKRKKYSQPTKRKHRKLSCSSTCLVADSCDSSDKALTHGVETASTCDDVERIASGDAEISLDAERAVLSKTNDASLSSTNTKSPDECNDGCQKNSARLDAMNSDLDGDSTNVNVATRSSGCVEDVEGTSGHVNESSCSTPTSSRAVDESNECDLAHDEPVSPDNGGTNDNAPADKTHDDIAEYCHDSPTKSNIAANQLAESKDVIAKGGKETSPGMDPTPTTGSQPLPTKPSLLVLAEMSLLAAARRDVKDDEPALVAEGSPAGKNNPDSGEKELGGMQPAGEKVQASPSAVVKNHSAKESASSTSPVGQNEFKSFSPSSLELSLNLRSSMLHGDHSSIGGLTPLPVLNDAIAPNIFKASSSLDIDILLARGILEHGSKWNDIWNECPQLQQLTTISGLRQRAENSTFQSLLERVRLDAAILDDPGALFHFCVADETNISDAAIISSLWSTP